MLGEKISFDFELFEVPDRKFGAYDRVGGFCLISDSVQYSGIR